MQRRTFLKLAAGLSPMLARIGSPAQQLVSYAAESLPREDELGPAPEGTFTVVVIPDTQRLCEKFPDVFYKITDWIARNAESQRIVFVSHVGDVVQNRFDRDEWEVASRAMEALDGVVPYAIALGNHDIDGNGKTVFRDFFPVSRLDAFPYYGGHYETNSFQLISAEGLDLIFVHLECNAPDDVLEWTNSILEEHADRRAVVTTHHYLGYPRDTPREKRFVVPWGRMDYSHFARGSSPQQMWEKCFRKHENLFLILCGCRASRQAVRQTSTGEHGNIVHELMSDYTLASRDLPYRHLREVPIRLMRFVPAQNRIEVRTYSPALHSLIHETPVVPDRDQHQFVLECSLRDGQ